MSNPYDDLKDGIETGTRLLARLGPTRAPAVGLAVASAALGRILHEHPPGSTPPKTRTYPSEREYLSTQAALGRILALPKHCQESLLLEWAALEFVNGQRRAKDTPEPSA